MVYKGTNLYVKGVYNDTISETNLSNQFQIKEQSITDKISILLNRYLFFNATLIDSGKEVKRILVCDLSLKKVIKLIDFDYVLESSHYQAIFFSDINGHIGIVHSYELQMIKPTDTDGDGRINISEFGHLIYIDNINSLDYHEDYFGKDYELDNDIDASDSKNWPYSAGFHPIGQSYIPFTGGFDGQGHKIINLYMNRPGEEGIAFFGFTQGTKKIENLTIENCYIVGGHYTAGLVANSSGGGIENCFVSGKVIGTETVGGLVGIHNDSPNKGIINGCKTDVVVTAENNNAGGLVGIANSAIINCSSSGVVTGTSRVGGLVGGNSSSTITNSFSNSVVNGRSNIGGLIGYNNRLGIISNCYSMGGVSGRSMVGGLVGYNQKGTIHDCYAMGDVSCDSTVGGLIGFDEAGKISNSFSVGAITGKIFMGGLVGFSNDGEFKNTFWDRETSGKIKSFGGTSKTTGEMKTKSTFTDAGWDFNNVWGIDDVTNMGYPFLRQIAVSVEMENIQKNSNILVYPNPTINKANLKVSLLENTNISIELYSLTGCKIKSIFAGCLANGEHNFDLDFSDCTTGIYSILININNEIINRWVVIQK